MIVEFTGCSGSGKTSLARRVHRLLRAERCADGPISRCLPATTFSHLTTELLGWPWMFVARRRYQVCDSLVRHWIRDVSLSRGEWLRLSRSWNRKLAMMGSYRTSAIASAVSLQDEGPIHFAMTLFARWPFCTTDALNRYLDHVPLPDRVVCVRASHERCALRLAGRAARPVPDRDEQARSQFLEQARTVLDVARDHPRVAPRMVSVENESDAPAALDELACTLVGRITTWCAETDTRRPGSIVGQLGCQESLAAHVARPWGIP